MRNHPSNVSLSDEILLFKDNLLDSSLLPPNAFVNFLSFAINLFS